MRNLLNLTCVVFVVLAFNISTFGQHQFGVKVSGGLSRISNSEQFPNVTLSTPYVPSGQGGFYYNHTPGEKSSLGAELLFSQIEGKEKREIDLIDVEGKTMGHVTNLFYEHISYFSLPVYYGFNIKKLTIHAGFQISRALAMSGREKSNATINELNVNEYSYDRKIDNINITNFDLGPKAGILYHFTNKLTVEGTYYYSIGNIDSRVPKTGELKILQMSIGVRYALWSKTNTQ